ncbi:unnamed protein product [Phyllotreta striolata]|uniref:Uncharacterized protein n=1 Tax=Phyllotreta striolata TaxID=444603 RepID=A0A9N9XIK8_PHYSR|nr:unnamed protein product [Phyllotreta striolata]
MKVSLVFLIFGFCGIALAGHSNYNSRHDASQHDRYRHSARNRAVLLIDEENEKDPTVYASYKPYAHEMDPTVYGSYTPYSPYIVGVDRTPAYEPYPHHSRQRYGLA